MAGTFYQPIGAWENPRLVQEAFRPVDPPSLAFSFDLEILYLADKFGYQVAEVPVQWIDAPGSKVDPAKEAQRFLRDLVKIKLNDLRGVYAKAQDAPGCRLDTPTKQRLAQRICVPLYPPSSARQGSGSQRSHLAG